MHETQLNNLLDNVTYLTVNIFHAVIFDGNEHFPVTILVQTESWPHLFMQSNSQANEFI